jgi:hypothetical protein
VPKYSPRESTNQRRQQVAEYLKLQMPQVEMAQRLGADQSAISRDVKAILKIWTEKFEEETEQLRAKEALALDYLEMIAERNMENAIRRRQDLETADKESKKSVQWERYDRSARAWLDQRLRIQTRRAELLNLNSQKTQTNVAVQVPISFITESRPDQRQLEAPEVLDGELVADGS